MAEVVSRQLAADLVDASRWCDAQSQVASASHCCLRAAELRDTSTRLFQAAVQYFEAHDRTPASESGLSVRDRLITWIVQANLPGPLVPRIEQRQESTPHWQAVEMALDALRRAPSAAPTGKILDPPADHPRPATAIAERAAVARRVEELKEAWRSVRTKSSLKGAFYLCPTGVTIDLKGIAEDLVLHGHANVRGHATGEPRAREFDPVFDAWAELAAARGQTLSRESS